MMTTICVLSKMTVYIFLLVFLMQHQTVAFMFFSSKSRTHQDITRTAILETTANICRMQALRNGMDFVLPNILTEESLARACSSSDSAKGFKRSINTIKGSNAWVDFYHVLNPIYHFDDESFLLARELITKGVITVKASVKLQSYEVARQKLGEVLHTLQDFYSHSNWIELGNKGPYSNLIKPSSQIDNIAGNMPTCRNCKGNNCSGNILEEIIAQQKLTSGYFSFFSSFKPEGKCSHGGFFDQTSRREPKGGINKDTIDSSHGFLHLQAADVATAATRELLEDIRAAVGDSEFLRLMGFSQTSVLCFVIDTTGSMSDDIAEVRRVTSYIINSKMGTATQPSEYILVPFNDPDYGPLTRTTDPDVFKKKIDALTAAGGGDGPEMCLSGLQLALTGSPPQTEIFVFTDAEAKDRELMSSVRALIETTKSVVTFMLTNALGARRRRDNGRLINSQQQIDSRLFNSSNQDYQNLAEASGGQAIEVTKETLHQATSIIVDSSNSSLVTLFQAVRNPAKAENFSVFVDSTLKKLMIYITCSSPYYIITSASGVSQTSAEPSGALGFIQMAGNIHIVHPNISDPAGLWLINITSTKPYSIKVFGQSDVDFLFDFVDVSQDNLSYAVLNSRPKANSKATLLVTMVGGDNVSLTGVALVETSSSNFVNGTLEEVTSGQYLVTINSIPAEEFIVRVSGEISSSRATGESFQRQFSTRLQASSVTITAQADGTLEPGKTFTLPFKVASNNYGGNVTIRVSNDRGLETVFPSSLTLVSGGEANGTISLVAPGNASSGSDVTVTIEAETPGGSDSNYAVLRFAVVSPVTDINPPVCEIVSMHANCSGNCSLFTWDFSVNITDGNGSGIQSVRDLQGKGTLNTSSILGDGGKNVTLAFYTASCCFQEVDLVAIDEVGNVGTCFRSTLNSGAPSSQNGFFGAQCSLVQQVCFWLNVGAILLYQIMPL